MKRRLGYQTPAARLQELEQEVEQLRTITGSVKDASLLGSLAVILSYQISANLTPKAARQIKDIYLDMLGKLDINTTAVKAIGARLTQVCDLVEGKK